MHARSRTKGHTMSATKTPRELIAECAEQLSADGHYELSLEIALLKAAQPVEPAARMPDYPIFPSSARYEVQGHKHFWDADQMINYAREHGLNCMRSSALAQPEPAAPYQVTDEDVQTVLDVYWAPGNSTVNGETMRRALEAYEARKAAA